MTARRTSVGHVGRASDKRGHEAMSAHTPVPWTAGFHGLTVDAVHPVRNDATGTTPLAFTTGYFGLEQQEANTAFIVRACNAHDDLVAALRAVVACGALDRSGADANTANALAVARAAIRKATEG